MKGAGETLTAFEAGKIELVKLKWPNTVYTLDLRRRTQLVLLLRSEKGAETQTRNIPSNRRRRGFEITTLSP